MIFLANARARHTRGLSLVGRIEIGALPMTVECPSHELLSRYAIGELDDDASDDIERHLAVCPACEDSLAQCDSEEDSLMRHLPLAASQAVEPLSQPPGWLAQLRTGPLEAVTAAPALAPRASEPPAEFSSYELLGVLGHGGMGVVYRARHRQLDRLVALKVLSPRLMATAEARRRFEREIRVLGSLHHPGIVMATDANRIDGAAYLVMELIDGVDLARLVRQEGPLTIAEACEAGRQIADALATAHGAGTIHRDIKPSNVMIDRLGRVKLLDFGLAHLAEASTESLDTSLGRLLGTLDYMAPEQADCHRPLDARVDLFGLGATLFYLLTGQPPHGDRSRGSLLAQLRALVAEEPPRVRTLRADVPPELDHFIARLLSRDPADRPESAESVARTLATWSGGDLAGRVATLRPASASDDAAATDGAIAQRSLSQLLSTGLVAVPEEIPAVAPLLGAKPQRRRSRVRMVAWAAAAALVGAVLFGVTILLKTPEGTLKIESDVDNVSVELVNDQDQAQPLQIQRGANETTLRAGAYRVRFAGEHDGIAIEPDRITLKRGEQTVARITRIATPDKDRGADPVRHPKVGSAKTPRELELADPNGVVSNGPLYQGVPERDWRQMFGVETSPTAKLDEAVALVTLAAECPPKERIEKILDVGAEIVHASFGDDVIDFALADPTKPPKNATRWEIKKTPDRYVTVPGSRLNRFGSRVAIPRDSEVREDLYSAYSRFQDRVNHDLLTIPAELLTTALSRAASGRLDFDRTFKLRAVATPRDAFAASLLRLPARSTIQQDPKAAQLVLHEMDLPPTGSDWDAVRLLVRMSYIDAASAEQAQQIANGIDQLGGQLQANPTATRTELLRSDLLEALKVEPKGGWPASVRHTMAGLILDGFISGPHSFYAVADLDFFSTKNNSQAQQLRVTYDPQYISQLREKSQRFLDQWLGVANGYLQKHARPLYGATVRDVAETVDLALLVYSDGDNWPVDETIALFTKQLQKYYTDTPFSRRRLVEMSLGEMKREPSDREVQSSSDILPMSPAALLTQIVRVTGEIPDFVKKGEPKPRPVMAKWERFETAVKAIDQTLSGVQDPQAGFFSLFNDDPYAVVKLAVQPAVAKKIEGQSFFMTPFTPDHVIGVASKYNEVDPLLLLALLADLTGESQAQDARIAALVKTWQPGSNMWHALENLFGSHLRAREHARSFLQKMMSRAKSPDLVNALRELNVPVSSQTTSRAEPEPKAGPSAPVSAATTEPSKSAPKVAPDAPLFQGVPASEWQRIFALETSPAAKLDEAIALVTLAAKLPPKDRIQRILDVGGEIVSASFGDDVIDFALADPTSPPTGAPHWQILGREGGGAAPAPRDDLYAAYSRFQQLVNHDVRNLPAEVLAAELSAAVRSGASGRGAFAASLLRGSARSVIVQNQQAWQLVSRQLDVPLKGFDWTALCLVVRVQYARNDTAELRKLAGAIDQLGEKLRAAASSPTAALMRSDLLESLKPNPNESGPAIAQRTIAELILDTIVREHRPFFQFVFVRWLGPNRIYDPALGAQQRRLDQIIGPWVTVANGYLKQHTAPPYDFADRQVVGSISGVSILYSENDPWPVEEAARLLTQQLRAYYSDDPQSMTDQPVEALLPATPSALLTDIVRVTGEIPDFVKTGYPRSRGSAERWQRFEKAVKSRDVSSIGESSASGFPGANQPSIAVDNPYAVVKLAVEAGKPQNQDAFSAQGILRWAARQSSDLDPLLYLATVTDLAGRKPAWDDNIALLVKNWKPGTDTRIGLEYLVAGKTKASDHARRLLQKMMTKAKSPNLVQALHDLNASLLSPRK
jgi:hypothetical protein